MIFSVIVLLKTLRLASGSLYSLLISTSEITRFASSVYQLNTLHTCCPFTGIRINESPEQVHFFLVKLHNAFVTQLKLSDDLSCFVDAFVPALPNLFILRSETFVCNQRPMKREKSESGTIGSRQEKLRSRFLANIIGSSNLVITSLCNVFSALQIVTRLGDSFALEKT